MLPPSPPLPLSFTLSAQTQSATTTTKNVANADLKLTLLLSQPQIQRAQRFQRSPLSLSIHACNDHLIFCTSIIFILFLVWFSSKTSSHKRRRIGHQWDRSSGGGAPRRGDTAIGYLILQGTQNFGQIA